MFFYAQYAAGFECLERRRKRLDCVAVAHPIVEVAKRQDEIGSARRGDVEVAATQRGFVDIAEAALLRIDLGAKALRAGVFLGISGCRQRNVEVTMAACEIGAQYVCPVATP